MSGRDDSTARRDAPAGYDPRLLRKQPEISWSDAAGTHTRGIEGPLVLGAAPQADLVIADEAVSRIHAELSPHEWGLQVRDLGSRNGTFVHGVRIQTAWVPEGGRLCVGGTELLIRYAPVPTPLEVWPAPSFGPLVGESLPMRLLFAHLARVAVTNATVLIQGETGTGKEVVARAIHEASPRAGRPFVIVDCAALPENLLEDELFGHVKGAFTDANTAREGAFEAADGGTVFLDEIGELSMNIQPKLLRVLESRTVRRLGQTEHRPIDVRFISATNRDLRQLVNERAFREDLFFRLAVLPVTVPPLRERPEDLPLLVRHFAGDGAGVPPEMLEQLAQRAWLGNVRELRNFVERALALGPREALALSCQRPSGAPAARLDEAMLRLPYVEAVDLAGRAIEREYLLALLERHGRNVTAAAKAAGVHRTYLHRLMRRHAL